MLSSPATSDLRSLQATLDRLGKAITDARLDWDAPEFEDAAEDRLVILDRIVSLRERVDAALVRRRPPTYTSYKVAAVGLLLLGQTPEERVRRAERDQLHPDSDRDEAPWHSYSPPLHPVAVGAPTELGVLALGWDAEGRTA